MYNGSGDDDDDDDDDDADFILRSEGKFLDSKKSE